MNVVAGVIGCGNIARLHFAGLAEAGVRVKWVCDPDEAAAAPWVKQLGAEYAADYRRVLEDPDVDVVDLLTLPSTHRTLCLDSIEAGKAVICEKTLAVNSDDALAIVRAAEDAGTIFYTAYMKRFLPAVKKARELLPSLGRILSTHIRAYQPWGALWDVNPEAGFAHKPQEGPSEVVRKYGGGILICGGSHILDLVCFFLGRPQRLFASMHTPPGRDYDLLASVLLETDHGPCHYEALAHPLTRVGYRYDGWDERMEINGTGGRIEIFSPLWYQGDTIPSVLVHYDQATGHVTEHRCDPVSPFCGELAAFCESIARGSQGEQSRLTGYDVDELIAHIKRSAETHQALDVAWRI